MHRLYIAIFLVAIIGCSHGPDIQSHYYGFENESWTKNTPLEFVFQIRDTSVQYSLNASLRYNEKFTYNRLNLNVSLLSPTGSSRFQGVAIDMTKADGTPAGKEIDGYLEISFPIYRNLRFKEKGNWVLNVMHKMPVDITRGLTGVEFELKPAE